MIWNWLGALVVRLPMVFMAVALLWGAQWVFERWMGKRPRGADQAGQRNPAYALIWMAYILSVGIAMAGALWMTSDFLQWKTYLQLGIEGVMILLLIHLSVLINDRFILYGFAIRDEVLKDRNMGVAFCVSGSTLATACILNGAFIGLSPSYYRELLDVVMYWLLGQVLLCVTAVCYRRLKTYDVHRLIEFDNNTAVGIGFGGMLVSIGMVVRASIVGAGEAPMMQEWLLSLLLSTVGVGLLFLAYGTLIPWLTAGLDLNDEIEMKRNTDLGMVMAGAIMGIAWILAALIQR